MEDSIQVIVGIIISVFIFFVFPVYMAYEKLDDISYVLAMRYTQDFVDNVRNKGYITKEMYDDYKLKLSSTGNSYDIQLAHRKTRIDPVVQYYKKDGTTYTLVRTDLQGSAGKLYKDAVAAGKTTESDIISYIKSSNGITDIVNTYLAEEEVFTTKDIEAVLNTENKLWLNATTDNFTCIDVDGEEDLESHHKKVKDCEYAYIMNENDNFDVIIRNTNTTVATAIYNMITVNTVDNNTRIYVNYGGTVLNEKWYGKIDYKKMKHDNLNIEKKVKYKIFEEAKEYDGTSSNFTTIEGYTNSQDEYMVEFEAKPIIVTELKPVGFSVNSFEEAKKYNLAIGTSWNAGGLQVGIGVNGVVVFQFSGSSSEVIISYPLHIAGYKKFGIELEQVGEGWYVNLYVDSKKVATSSAVTGITQLTKIGGGHLYGINMQYFKGYIRNVYLYK